MPIAARYRSLLLATVSLAPALSAIGAVPVMITDPTTGNPPLYPSYITIYDNQLYFRASDYPSGTNAELWRFDGLHAEQAADVMPGSTGSSPAYLASYSGKLYFQAAGPGGGTKLWQYDPTNGASLAPGGAANPSVPDELTVYDGNLYFRAAKYSSPNIGIELWKFDGNTQQYIDLYPGTGSSYPQHFIEYDGLLYFNASTPGNPGTELHRTSNGADAVRITNIKADGSSPEDFAVYDNRLFFSANDGVHGRELWSFDSTTGQANLAADIVAGDSTSSSNPSNLAVYDGKLYFSATDNLHGYELWVYDGTTASMVAEINPTPNPGNGDGFLMDSSPADLTVFDGLLYFSADDGVHGRELWSYDGTDLSMVFDLNPGPYGSGVQELTVFNNTLYFSADPISTDGGNRPVAFAIAVPEPALLGLLPGALLLFRRRRSTWV